MLVRNSFAFARYPSISSIYQWTRKFSPYLDTSPMEFFSDRTTQTNHCPPLQPRLFNPKTSTISYSPLDEDLDEIRLISILPHSGDSKLVHCNVEIVSLKAFTRNTKASSPGPAQRQGASEIQWRIGLASTPYNIWRDSRTQLNGPAHPHQVKLSIYLGRLCCSIVCLGGP